MQNKLYLITYFALCISLTTAAQYYEGFNYQAVIRDGGGDILANDAVTLRFTIHQTSAAGTIVYQESHATTTNEFGLVNLTIGEGTVLSGSWLTIQWYWYEYYLQVETDLGSGYVNLGTQQMQSVPFAKSAWTSAYATDMVLNDLNDVSYPNYLSDGMSLVYSEADESWIAATTPASTWQTNFQNTYLPIGNLGVGTSVPNASIHIQSLSDEQNARAKFTNYLTGSNYTDGSEVGIDLAGNMQFMNWEATDFIFTTGVNLTDRFHIRQNGNIGIGISVPQSPLHLHKPASINNYMQFTNDTYGNTVTDGVLLGLASDGNFQLVNQENKNMNFYTNNTNRMTISNTGDVGIGDSSPDAKLDVAGTVQGSSLQGLNMGFGGNRDVYADNDGVLQVAPSKTYYYSIPACEFDVTNNSDVGSADTDTDFEIEFTPDMYDIQEDWGIYYVAPVHLPHGAKVISWFATVYDTDPDVNLRIEMNSTNVYNGGYGDYPFDDSEEVSSGSSGMQTLGGSFFASPIIDNAYNAYYVRASLTTTGPPDSESLKIVSVVFVYELHP